MIECVISMDCSESILYDITENRVIIGVAYPHDNNVSLNSEHPRNTSHGAGGSL